MKSGARTAHALAPCESDAACTDIAIFFRVKCFTFRRHRPWHLASGSGQTFGCSADRKAPVSTRNIKVASMTTTAVRHPAAVGLAGALALAADAPSRALIQTVTEGGSSTSQYCAPQEGRVGSAKDLLPWLAWLGPFGLCERGRMASWTTLIRVRYGNDFGHPFKFLVLFHPSKRTTTAAADLVTKTLYASALVTACSRSHVP
jgi:hypothetical protein